MNESRLGYHKTVQIPRPGISSHTERGIQQAPDAEVEIPSTIPEQPEPIVDVPKHLDLHEGQMIQDEHGKKYHVRKKLGAGGQGGVYLIQDDWSEIERALKVIPSETLNRQSSQEREKTIIRMQRENAILKRLNNPFILPAFDFIKFNVGEHEEIGVVTDFVEGTDVLREIYKETEKRMLPEKVLVFAGELAVALQSLADAKDEKGESTPIVHGDIKPANLFLQDMPNGEQILRLGDFGTARTVSLDGSISKMENFEGTVEYMSPEQLKMEQPTLQSDLYSFGATMYAMLSGHLPFDKDMIAEMILKKRTEFPRPRFFKDREINNVPVWLENIVIKLLSNDPKDRFGSAIEVFALLKEGIKEETKRNPEYKKLLEKTPFDMNFGSHIDTSQFAALQVVMQENTPAHREDKIAEARDKAWGFGKGDTVDMKI